MSTIQNNPILKTQYNSTLPPPPKKNRKHIFKCQVFFFLGNFGLLNPKKRHQFLWNSLSILSYPYFWSINSSVINVLQQLTKCALIVTKIHFDITFDITCFCITTFCLLRMLGNLRIFLAWFSHVTWFTYRSHDCRVSLYHVKNERILYGHAWKDKSMTMSKRVYY